MKFKIGDKVRIKSKSIGISIQESNVYRRGGGKNGIYWIKRIGSKPDLYVVSEKKGNFLFLGGDLFHANDLELITDILPDKLFEL